MCGGRHSSQGTEGCWHSRTPRGSNQERGDISMMEASDGHTSIAMGRLDGEGDGRRAVRLQMLPGFGCGVACWSFVRSCLPSTDNAGNTGYVEYKLTML